MKQLKYKVEAFIIPAGNNCDTNFKTNNTKTESEIITDAVVNIEQNEFNRSQDYQSCSASMEEKNMQQLKKCESAGQCITEVKLYINNFDKDSSTSFRSLLDINPIRYGELSDNNFCYPTCVNGEVPKLTPIDEKNEHNVELDDLCYHGCKNGCSATVPTPQEVSEEIFKESWLQKLKDIKQRESALRSREIILMDREKVLLEKEEKLKALESMLKDKLKKVDLQLKETSHFHHIKVDILDSQKNVSTMLSDINLQQISGDTSDTSKGSEEELNNLDINKMDLQIKNVDAQKIQQKDIVHAHTCMQHVETASKVSCEEKTSSVSLPSSLNNLLAEKKTKQHPNTRSYVVAKSSRFKSTYVSNSRLKRSCKISYEDLDTTLSADVGDTSYVQTSEKFNPALYKKPFAFRRTRSERYSKHINLRSTTNLEVENLNCQGEEHPVAFSIGQDKVLKKVTQNIFASQDRGTKFQHYGLIDENIVTGNVVGTENEEKYSYLNLETNSKPFCYQKPARSLNRPVSWNEQTNEWLQKKRMAYNMTMKKNHADKENLDCDAIPKDNAETMLKKKDIKSKIFTLFR